MGVVPATIAVGLITRFPWGFAERVDPVQGEHWAWTGTLAMGGGLAVWLALPSLPAVRAYLAAER